MKKDNLSPAPSGAGDNATSSAAAAYRRRRADPWRRLNATYDELDREPTSWRFAPLDVSHIAPPPVATFCRRDDGQGLVITNMAHSFFGDAESMKTWLVNFLIRERLHDVDDDGRPIASVMYLDCERSRSTFVRRMASIGTDLEALRAVCAYFRVTDPLLDRRGDPTDGYRDLDIALDYFDPGLLVIDGVTEFMAIHGWDARDERDVAKYHALLLRRWPGQRTTLEVDHTAKAWGFGSNRTQLGSQHKRAGIDGASYEVERVFSEGNVSIAKVMLRKDNEHAIREHCDDDVAAFLQLDSNEEPWRLRLLAPETWETLGIGPQRKPNLGDRAVAVLAASGGEMTVEQVHAAVNEDGGDPATNSGVKAALGRRRKDGAVISREVPGSATLWSARAQRIDAARPR